MMVEWWSHEIEMLKRCCCCCIYCTHMHPHKQMKKCWNKKMKIKYNGKGMKKRNKCLVTSFTQNSFVCLCLFCLYGKTFQCLFASRPISQYNGEMLKHHYTLSAVMLSQIKLQTYNAFQSKTLAYLFTCLINVGFKSNV